MTLLTVKELANVLRKHPSYVYAMTGQGFKMPGGTATIEEARAWLARHPHPRKKPRPSEPRRGV